MDRGGLNPVRPLSDLARLNEAGLAGLPNPTTSSVEEQQTSEISATRSITNSCNPFSFLSDSDPSNEIIAQSDGIMVWRISHVGQKISDAVARLQNSIMSPVFQTPNGDQKVWVCLYLNGDTDCKYLAIYLCLQTPMCAGFHGDVNITIIDQTKNRPRTHITRTCSGALNKIGDRLGFDTFADKNLLHVYRSRYIRDDQIEIVVKQRSAGEKRFSNFSSNIRDALDKD